MERDFVGELHEMEMRAINAESRISELEASCAAMREALEKAKDALNASTHEANDYNCQDWPPGEGCRGCDGDELREQAVKQIESVLAALDGDGKEEGR